MNSKTVTYKGATLQSASDKELEAYYKDFVLPLFGIEGVPAWERHVQIDPDNYLHIFTTEGARYTLTYDDYLSDPSVNDDISLRKLRLKDDTVEVLKVELIGLRFEMNISGYFMLYRVVDDKAFDGYVNYLEIAYKKQRQKWRGTGGTVAVARDVLQITETASLNHDKDVLYALQNIVDAYITYDVNDASVDLVLLKKYIDILLDAEWGYEFHDEAARNKAAEEVYYALSREADYQITAHKYHAANLGEMATLVSALYGKEENGMTSGITAVVLFEGDEIRYPLEHFINDELRQYFADNPYIKASNIGQHLPETLQDYQLVEGSVEIQKIFQRELPYIYF